MNDGRRRGSWTVAAWMAWLLGGAIISCTPVGRYHALSMFFDGVPPPPGVEPVVRPKTETDYVMRGLIPPPAKPRATPAPLVIVSRHEPFARNQCRECHETRGIYGIPVEDAKLCDKCHMEQRVEEGWDHGPINLGSCIPCHRAHESPYPALLAQPIPELCLDCHADVEDPVKDYHLVVEFAECTACHDPHLMY